eukprot:8426443-Pyramimonas_sp.AAC.1
MRWKSSASSELRGNGDPTNGFSLVCERSTHSVGAARLTCRWSPKRRGMLETDSSENLMLEPAAGASSEGDSSGGDESAGDSPEGSA